MATWDSCEAPDVSCFALRESEKDWRWKFGWNASHLDCAVQIDMTQARYGILWDAW